MSMAQFSGLLHGRQRRRDHDRGIRHSGPRSVAQHETDRRAPVSFQDWRIHGALRQILMMRSVISVLRLKARSVFQLKADCRDS